MGLQHKSALKKKSTVFNSMFLDASLTVSQGAADFALVCENGQFDMKLAGKRKGISIAHMTIDLRHSFFLCIYSPVTQSVQTFYVVVSGFHRFDSLSFSATFVTPWECHALIECNYIIVIYSLSLSSAFNTATELFKRRMEINCSMLYG